MSARWGTFVCALAASLSLAPQAWADGVRDLNDGVAFYENLDLARARERLQAASLSPDLDTQGRARAFLYIGLLEFELGNRPKAESAWTSAFELDHEAGVPEGTSPKTITALEAVRARTQAVAQPPPPTVTEPPPSDPEPLGPAPGLEPKLTPQPPPLVAPAPEPEHEDSNLGLWIGVGAGVAAVAGAVVLGVLLSGGSDGECPRGGGAGCLSVTLQ